MNNELNKKYKRPKQKTLATTNPDALLSVQYQQRPSNNRDEDRSECPEIVCPLLAKDSEWVDILQSPLPEPVQPSSSTAGDEEAILQLVECEDGPQLKPLAIIFPGLLEKDPHTLEKMLTKSMSTTEVTKHLVDLGEKANFTCMKQSNKLIPRDKQWLESLTENSNSQCSLQSNLYSCGFPDAGYIGNDSKTNKEKEFNIHINKDLIITEDSLSSFEAVENRPTRPQKSGLRKLKKNHNIN